MTYLHRPIALVGDLDPDPLPASVELYRFSMCGDDSARLVLVLIELVIEWRKVVLRWDRKVTTIESFAKIAFVTADGLVDRNQVRACGKCPFDLQLLERGEDTWVNMSAAQDLLPERHQFRDRVLCIAYEL